MSKKKSTPWENEVTIGILFLSKYPFYYKALSNVTLELANSHYLYMNYKPQNINIPLTAAGATKLGKPIKSK